VSFFHEKFLKEVRLTPAEYLTRLRMKKAKQLLKISKKSITEIAFDLGFSSSQYFATVFKKVTGITPRFYRKQVAPEDLGS
jgi:AraC-like DNA-binding protein